MNNGKATFIAVIFAMVLSAPYAVQAQESTPFTFGEPTRQGERKKVDEIVVIVDESSELFDKNRLTSQSIDKDTILYFLGGDSKRLHVRLSKTIDGYLDKPISGRYAFVQVVTEWDAGRMWRRKEGAALYIKLKSISLPNVVPPPGIPPSGPRAKLRPIESLITAITKDDPTLGDSVRQHFQKHPPESNQ